MNGRVFLVSSLAAAVLLASPAAAFECSGAWSKLTGGDQASSNKFTLAAEACKPSAARVSKVVNTTATPAVAAAAAPILSEQLRLYDAEVAYASATEPRPLLMEAYRTVAAQPPRARAAQRSRAATRSYPEMVTSVARKHDIDPDLLQAIMFVESRANPKAVSHAGARGLMQVMPATARRFGVRQPLTELHDPYTNLNVAAVYLKKLQKLFGNDLKLVLAGYNAGEGAVIKYGRKIPPYRETQGYVVKVMDRYQSLRRGGSIGQ